MNVFADDITIEDDMAVLVKYDNKATMTYHLTAYSVSRVLFKPIRSRSLSRPPPWLSVHSDPHPFFLVA